MTNQAKQLRQELRQAGASTAEITSLLPIAANLRLLQQPKPKRASIGPWWQKLFRPAVFIVPSLAVGMALIILSQAVSPTSLLYPAQKLSDNIVVAMHPQYRAEVMMKRARQVNQLVAAHASANVVLATLASYTTEAQAYKASSHSSYAAFEYCKSNLQQASTTAPLSVRRAIATSLDSLAS